ncbi:MAG: hypothetical protein AB1642_03195 [Pseudomonadota bacterium]
MAHPWLVMVGALRALVEVALFFLLGQGLLALLAGGRRQANPVYRLFVIVTAPVLKLIRRITPARVIDGHLPFVAVLLLFWAWVGLAWLKQSYCAANLLQCF